MRQEIFFHGTNRFVLAKILEGGLMTRYGRATLVTNPKYAVGYSYISKTYLKSLIKDKSFEDIERIKERLILEKVITTEDLRDNKVWIGKADDYFKEEKFVVQDGVMLVFRNVNNIIGAALDGEIKIHPRKKVIDGQPNRFKTEQYGFFPKKKTGIVVVDKKYLVGVFAYSERMLKILDQISCKIIKGRLKQVDIQRYSEKLEKILGSKKIQIIEPKVSLPFLSEQMIYGMVRNLILREIRQTYLSIMRERGWRIVPSGDHPVKLKDREEIRASLEMLKKAIVQSFVSEDIKKECRELLDKMF